MNRELRDAIARLQDLGFKKRAGAVFTYQLSDGVEGWLGLNRATRHLPAGMIEITPVVGVRHQGVERVVADLRGVTFHPYQPPTVSIPVRKLTPELTLRRWILGADPDIGAEGLVNAVAEYGLPFMRSGSTLTAICRLIDQGVGFEHQLIFRRPVAWQLAGERAHALMLVDSTEAELAHRADAAANEFRNFAREFRNRFAVSED